MGVFGIGFVFAVGVIAVRGGELFAPPMYVLRAPAGKLECRFRAPMQAVKAKGRDGFPSRPG
jgi:hypothetical protein